MSALPDDALTLMVVVDRIRNDANEIARDVLGTGETWQVEPGWDRDRHVYEVAQRSTRPGEFRRLEVCASPFEEVATYLAHWRPDTARAVADLLEAVALGEDERTFVAARKLAHAYVTRGRNL